MNDYIEIVKSSRTFCSYQFINRFEHTVYIHMSEKETILQVKFFWKIRKKKNCTKIKFVCVKEKKIYSQYLKEDVAKEIFFFLKKKVINYYLNDT